MNILFLTLLDFASIEERSIYTDLMREFVKRGHYINIISPTEKRKNQPTELLDFQTYKILKLRIGNIQKTNLLEKGISTLTLENIFINGIKEYFSNIKFDLVLYSTPPVTLIKAVSYIRLRDGAKTYLMLKDIFPQNAVDLGMLSQSGLKSHLYRYFRKKEKSLYAHSDFIGCMSQANVDYILKYNPEILKNRVEICPNSIEAYIINNKDSNPEMARIKYKIPNDKLVLIYGGNIGKPQGIDFLIKCLKSNISNTNVYFIIVGAGTEMYKIEKFVEEEKPSNVKIIANLPHEEYEMLLEACDVGLIFIDNRFTIPNFPSRILSYMYASMPILAATDINTDIGRVIEEGNFGFWCESKDVQEFNRKLLQFGDMNLRNEMGLNAKEYLEEHYTSKYTYEIIMKHFKNREA